MQNTHGKKKRGPSFSKDYLIFALCCFAIALCICGWVSWSTYQTQVEQRFKTLETAADKIESTGFESFSYVLYLMDFLSKQISTNGADTPYVLSLYRGFQDDFKVKNLSSWSMFDWLTPDQKIIITSVHGLLKTPVDMSFRPNVKAALQEPGKVFINKPDMGTISKQLIIPVTRAVTNSEQKVLGLVNIGISVASLTKKIDSVSSDPNLRFAILTEDFEVVTESSSNNPKLAKDFFARTLSTIRWNPEGVAVITKELTHNNIRYVYFKKSAHYPYVIAVGYDTIAAAHDLYEVLLWQVGPLLGLTIIFAAMLYRFRQHMVLPIVRLSDAADRIAHGYTSFPIPASSTYEIANLSKQMRKVQEYTKELKDAHKQLKEVNEHLEERVRFRTLELQKSLYAKTEFLNNMSHEIKTPMQTLMTVSEGLMSHWEDYSDEEKYKYLQDFHHNTRRLYDLLMNLLDISRMQSNKMSYDMTYCDLTILVKEILHECYPLVEAKHMKLLFVPPSPGLKTHVLGDNLRLTQVLRNLIVNAVRYAEKGTITATLETASIKRSDGSMTEGIAFVLRDEGKGIPEDERETIFDVFSQSSRTKTGAGGTGLGLAVCREIIHAHQGRIWAENNAGGPGSTFTFVIPIATEMEPAIRENTSLVNLAVTENKPIAVLMIDDEPNCLSSMQMMLRRSHYKLITAEGGQAGLDYLREHEDEIDAILLDLMMPDVYGLNVLAAIRANPGTRDLPVILQSGISDLGEIAKAQALNITAFLPKPYSRQELFAALEQIAPRKKNSSAA